MVNREDPQSPRTFWPGSMCVRLCLPGPCWAGVFSKTAFCSGFQLGRKGLNHSCSFPSTFRVLVSGKHFMCSPRPGTGTWVGLYSDSLSNIWASSFIYYYFFSNSWSCDLFLDWENSPCVIIFANTSFTQTLHSESFLALSPDTQNSAFSNSMKIGFPPLPTTAIALNFTSPF